MPATWELYVEMRFTQLRTACDLELWAEAFRRYAAVGAGWEAAAAVGPSFGIVLARKCGDTVVGLMKCHAFQEPHRPTLTLPCPLPPALLPAWRTSRACSC